MSDIGCICFIRRGLGWVFEHSWIEMAGCWSDIGKSGQGLRDRFSCTLTLWQQHYGQMRFTTVQWVYTVKPHSQADCKDLGLCFVRLDLNMALGLAVWASVSDQLHNMLMVCRAQNSHWTEGPWPLKTASAPVELSFPLVHVTTNFVWEMFKPFLNPYHIDKDNVIYAAQTPKYFTEQRAVSTLTKLKTPHKPWQHWKKEDFCKAVSMCF